MPPFESFESFLFCFFLGQMRTCVSKLLLFRLLLSVWSLWSTRGQHCHLAAIHHAELRWPVLTSSLQPVFPLLRLVPFRPCWSRGHPSPWTGSRRRDVAPSPRTSASLLGTWGMALSWKKHTKTCPLSQVGVLYSYWRRNGCSCHIWLTCSVTFYMLSNV